MGLRWIVSHENAYECTLIAEEFAATCQIVAADLAGIDLGLLPTIVELDIGLNDNDEFSIADKPDNQKAAWTVSFPRRWLASPEHLGKFREKVTGVVGAVFHGCSVLDDRSFFEILDSAFREGLAAKTFSVRSYAELYGQILPKEIFESVDRGRVRPPWYEERFEHRVPVEMAWKDTPGRGYTKEKSEELIQNRYRNAVRPIQRSLRELLQVPEFRALIRSLREEGLKDWFILIVISNLIVQFRVDQKIGRGANLRRQEEEMKNEMWREEPQDSVVPPMTLFSKERIEMQKNVTWVTIAKTWDLNAPRQTPDFSAFRNFLTSRYGCGGDDVEHIDPFPGVNA